MSDADHLARLERIASFPYWHYEFDLGGIRTPVLHPGVVNRHRQRRGHFFDPLIEACGGSLGGLRVLDLGCNAGYWMLAALEAGADFVLGIDGRGMHIEQARLVLGSHRIDATRYELVEGDVYHVDTAHFGAFDIVLCLGLLYHVSKHVELLERIAAVNRDLLVIDTALVGIPGRFVHWKREQLESPLASLNQGLVGYPSKKLVTTWVADLGYAVRTLRPRFTSWQGCSDYRWGARRAFIAARETPLGGIGEEDRQSVFSQAFDPMRYLAFMAQKLPRGGRV